MERKAPAAAVSSPRGITHRIALRCIAMLAIGSIAASQAGAVIPRAERGFNGTAIMNSLAGGRLLDALERMSPSAGTLPSPLRFAGEGDVAVLDTLKDPAVPLALALVSPNGGELTATSYDMPVVFTADAAGRVSLELSTDNGGSWVPYGIRDVVAGTNMLVLRTPDGASGEALVRLTNVGDPLEQERSDAPFRIARPILEVTSPNGKEELVAGDTALVAWKSDSIPTGGKVALDYSIDGGTSWHQIASDLSAADVTNSYRWRVPALPTVRGMARVRLQGGNAVDNSDAYFKIAPLPSVEIVSPNGGEKLYGGGESVIRWSSTTTRRVVLEYSIDGKEWRSILPAGESLPAVPGEYRWSVPVMNATTVMVRVMDAERSHVADRSDAPFSITNALIQVLSPNGGDKFEPMQEVTVRWDAKNVKSVRIDYSSDNGATWRTMATGVAATVGFHRMQLPPQSTLAALVRVVDPEREDVQDRSDSSFQVLRSKQITVMSPAAGESLVRGSVAPIIWEAEGVATVNIFYMLDGSTTWTLLQAEVAATDGGYSWRVPNETVVVAKIRVQDAHGTGAGESGSFSIVDPSGPQVRLIAPNGGETFQAGAGMVIRWSASGASSVSLFYSRDNGATWKSIQESVPALLGELKWNAPAAPGNAYLVRVVAQGSDVADISDAPFAVVRPAAPGITLISPNGGERFITRRSTQIQWSASGVTGPMAAQYSLDNGGTWQDIGVVMADGDAIHTIDWMVPATPTPAGRIRVVSSSTMDISDRAFEIVRPERAPIVVVAPNGGERWQMRSERLIVWNAPVEVPSVDLEFSLNNGATWQPIASNIPAASREYLWMVPGYAAELADVVLVRVRNSTDGAHFDISNAPFSLAFGLSGVEDAADEASGLKLEGNFPNPFAVSTELRWHQGVGGDVAIRLFEQTGRPVKSYELRGLNAGAQRFAIDGRDLSAGVYLYEVRTAAGSSYGMMTLVR